jgi:hypothetical protein
MQWVIFNPRYNNSYEYNKRPYSILRISHYTKGQYSLSSKNNKKNRSKIWHNFRMHLRAIVVQTETGESKRIWLEDISNDHNYYFRESIILQLGIE